MKNELLKQNKKKYWRKEIKEYKCINLKIEL